MKKKILDFLIKIGKKCKPLTYPVMIVVIAFLTIYHAIRNLFIKKENKWKSLVTGAICLVAVVGAVLVLPSLADEMTGESQTETVSEEELEPTMTPDVTVEPVHFATKYSSGWDLSYISQDPSAWNNVYMAEYYGLDSLRLAE
mgnify:CR=1 FL=1